MILSKARELLKQSKYGGPEGLLHCYTDGGIGSYVSSDVLRWRRCGNRILVNLKIENIEYNFYYEQIYSGNHGQIFVVAGVPIIPTQKILPMCFSTANRIKIMAAIQTLSWINSLNRPALNRM
jgi:hypothetical protein